MIDFEIKREQRYGGGFVRLWNCKIPQLNTNSLRLGFERVA